MIYQLGAATELPTVDLSAGVVDYEDTGGNGPPLLFIHGLLMNHTLFTEVLSYLRSDFRCLVPVLPLGSHRVPMQANADLATRGLVALVIDFMDALALDEVSLIGSDLGIAQIIAAEHGDRVSKLVLCAQEAFDNFPPGLPGKAIGAAAKIPGGVNAAVQPLRIRALRRLPIALGRMSSHPIPNRITDLWFAPALRSRRIRRDLAKYAGPIDRHEYIRVLPDAPIDRVSVAGCDRLWVARPND